MIKNEHIEEQEILFDKKWDRSVKNFYTKISCVDKEYFQTKALTSLVFLPKTISEKMYSSIREVRKKYPEQYYFTSEKLHFTFLGIIDPLKKNLTTNEIREIETVFYEALRKIKKFKITVKGFNIADSVVAAKLFCHDKTLINARKKVIVNLKKINNPYIDINRLEKNYNANFAWSTIIRYKNKKLSGFINSIEKLRYEEFGTFTVNNIDIVTSEHSLEKKNVKKLYSIELRR